MKVIDVIVNADHRTVKEINKVTNPTMGKRHINYEKTLKVYEIEMGLGEVFHKYNRKFDGFWYMEEGTKLKGTILPNGRIKIIVDDK